MFEKLAIVWAHRPTTTSCDLKFHKEFVEPPVDPFLIIDLLARSDDRTPIGQKPRNIAKEMRHSEFLLADRVRWARPEIRSVETPGECGDRLDDLPVAAKEIRAALLETFDRQQQIAAAARLVARHLTLGHSPDTLIATLAQALLREDAGFHAYQMLEAGVRQFHEWGNGDQGRHILIAVARYLAAHFPTERALLQTADIASRLMRGGELHREAQAVG